MGNTLKRITPGGGTEEKKSKDINSIIHESYGKHFEHFENRPKEAKAPGQELAEFYRAVCEIVEEMNRQRGNTQFNVPEKSVLENAFKEYFPNVDPPTRVGLYFRLGDEPLAHHQEGTKLKEEDFAKILQEVIRKTAFSGGAARDTLIYIFGVPITALFIKNAVMPNAIKNDYFIPGITSATVLVLAKLNKI